MGRSLRDVTGMKGTAQRRDSRSLAHDGERSKDFALKPDHPAAVEGRTRYPKSKRLNTWPPLKSGYNNAKIGKIVTKGKWAGMAIYTLTLEERATCPRSCAHWLDCYGNKMPFSSRQTAGAALEKEIDHQLISLHREHPKGFLVRLHVLGDFYSREYVRQWRHWLEDIPTLHIYGYTAWGLGTDIGSAVSNYLHHPRAAIRFSDNIGEWTTTTIETEAAAPVGSIVCPAQTGKTECCGSCALCWQTEKQIAFLRH